MRRLSYNFKYKVKQGAEGENKTIIEGYANRAFKDGGKIIDRGREHIPVNEWKISEWLDNPIILFNHNKDIPIGRGLDIKITDDGLWIKAMISQSEAPEIKKVRDLIEEKILNSFSVGVNPEDEYEEDGAIILKGVNLLETSVVALPMNQASQFEISTKMLKQDNLNSIKEVITKEKGAFLASEVHRQIGKMQEENNEFSREDMLTKIASQADISLDDLFEFLAGNMREADEKLISSLSNNLSLPQDRLMQLNSVDIAINQNLINRPDEIEPEDEEIIENEEEAEEDIQNDQYLVEIEEEEESEEMLEEGGEDEEKGEFDGESVEEGDEKPLADDTEEEEPKKKELDPDKEILTEDFNDCVSKYIREGLEHGKSQDQAIAYALSKCRKDKSCPTNLNSWHKIFDEIDKHKMEGVQLINGVPMTTCEGQGYVESSPGDNHLHEVRQTNVLLGQLIGEIQALKQILGGAMLAAPQALALSGKCLNDIKEKDDKESLDIIADYHRKLDQRLKKLDV